MRVKMFTDVFLKENQKFVEENVLLDVPLL